MSAATLISVSLSLTRKGYLQKLTDKTSRTRCHHLIRLTEPSLRASFAAHSIEIPLGLKDCAALISSNPRKSHQ